MQNTLMNRTDLSTFPVEFLVTFGLVFNCFQYITKATFWNFCFKISIGQRVDYLHLKT